MAASQRHSHAGRRAFLARGGLLAAAFAAGGLWPSCASRGGAAAPLAATPDENGLLLPPGVTSRVVARSGQPVAVGAYSWHDAPDGGATFPTTDGGWIYVSNSELAGGMGGAAALRFDPAGQIVAGYPILQGTDRNCAGGATPWGTWLSCEETAAGRVWECDPLGVQAAVARPALGVFAHEAVAVDPIGQQLYLTEDLPDGRLYRFTPASYPDLAAGTLEVARVVSGTTGAVAWDAVSDPSAAGTPTRLQVPASTPFNGGEGIAWHAGLVIFTTKGDDRVWSYDTATANLTVLYDAAASPDPILTGVDNVTVASDGTILVAEDGGDMQLVALRPSGAIVPIVQVLGHDQSEITGPAFDPSGERLYFSSQRGAVGTSAGGITYELRGPLLG